jgi:hypothetical protein
MEYTTSALDALRLEGDPLADEVITTLAAAGQIDAVNDALRHLRHNGAVIPPGLPPVLAAYLHATSEPPPAVDYARLRRVHAFFQNDGMQISALLAIGALIGCYAVPHGAKLLSMTHRLDRPHRRLAESGTFTLYLMDEQALEPGGRFIPAAQKVRLIHARVRHLIRESGQWPAHHGVPICQEDLLGALMVFSVQLLEVLHRLGLPPTSQEAEDYYYTWCVAGQMLGIRPEIIPPTIAEAQALSALIKGRHIGASDEGRALTHNLLTMYQGSGLGKLYDGMLPALVRLVVEDDIADMLEIPRSGWDRIMAVVPRLVAWIDRCKDEHSAVRRILNQVSYAILTRQLGCWGAGRPIHFDIPAHLRAGWGLGAAPASGCPMGAHRPAPPSSHANAGGHGGRGRCPVAAHRAEPAVG